MFYYIVFITILGFSIRSLNADCHFKFNALSKNYPLLLTHKKELWVPDGPELKLPNKEVAYAVCTGPKNYFDGDFSSKTESVYVTVGCDGNTLKINGQDLDIRTLSCHNKITGDLQETSKSCGHGGVVKHIGFDAHDLGFIPYIDVCFDMNSASVLFTYHMIRGKAIKYSDVNEDRLTFKTVGMPSGVKPLDAYKKVKQLKVLNAVLGEGAGVKFLSEDYLVRGHLVPDNDGIFKTWQYATYFFVNVAPEWQWINSANWIRVENVARTKAGKLNTDLEVYTGVHGILRLSDNAHKDVKITLQLNKKIPVPEFFWKVLKHNDEGIAFVTMNNPYAKKAAHLCRDVCNEYGWSNSAYHKFGKGYTYCCEVNELAKALNIPELKNLHINHVMRP